MILRISQGNLWVIPLCLISTLSMWTVTRLLSGETRKMVNILLYIYYSIHTFSALYKLELTCTGCIYRHARGREEWESAALQNANTKCNGLLPLWGPHVQESAFATCLARYTYDHVFYR